MSIRKAREKEFPAIADICTSFFKVHNIFQQQRKRVISYLKEQAKENSLFVSEQGGSINGFLILVNTGSDILKKHKIWKFRHFVYNSEKTALELLTYAENQIKKSSATAKIELTIAENEPGIAFYKARGYTQEAALQNHYRWGETCFILSKSFHKNL